jgi:4-amino-4-deoxy-L-arabinose transferase-like glycosyltransferase
VKRLGRVFQRHPDLWLALGITLLAAALRFPAISQHPPGFYHDEAFNGLDALRILDGELPVFLPSNGGREAGFMYVVAPLVALLGRSPAAVRLVSALMGTLIVPATFLLGRALYDRRIGGLAAAIVALMVVPLHLSRIGFRVVSVPFAISWFLWAVVRAHQTGRGWRWTLAGLLYGLTFHTYTSSRITPFALILIAVYVLVKGEWRRLWPGVVWFGLAGALTFAPIGLYSLNHPDIYFGRTVQTASVGLAGGLSGVLSQLLNTAGMFFVRGDTYPRHNVPGRPFFDPLLAVAFLLGLLALWRDEKRARSVFVVVWLAITALTTLLSIDPPHFLRTTPMFPMLALPPALGLAWLWEWAEPRIGKTQSSLATMGLLGISLALSLTAYFSPRYRLDENTYYQMDTSAVEMALEINHFLGLGWDGQGWRADSTATHPDRRVLLPEPLWNFSETNRYLVPLEPTEGGPLSLIESPADVPDTVGDGFLLLLVPGDEAEYVSTLPEGGIIAAHRGPFARADLETGEAPFMVYVAYQVMPLAEPLPTPEGEFAAGMALLDHEIELANGEATVRLLWQAREAIGADYTLFVHILSEGGQVGQWDAPIGEGLYPTGQWRPGDLVLEERVIPLESNVDSASMTLNVGFYAPENGERVNLLGGGDTLALGAE